ncbi:hypothetical protein [Methylocaldum marinum]|uniref:hypothetical protein n=1 Tax=Methylocaldum marinum TaxID=1432792 RepID=UPI000E67ABBC|nr:hypothetical protein [Methylocaldum marinum]
MAKPENAVFALLIGISALAVNQAWAGRGGSGERQLDRPREGRYQEQIQDLRQERKSFQQESRSETRERARDRGVGREGMRPSQEEGRRGSLMTPDEREGSRNQYRELREERKSLRGTTDGAGSGRGRRGEGTNR